MAHALTLPSAQPAAIVRPSGEQATLKTSPPVSSVWRSPPVAVSRILTWPGLFQSPSPEIRVWPFGENASDHTSPSCALTLSFSSRVTRFQVLSVPYRMPAASVWPSGEIATDRTSESVASNVAARLRDVTRHNLIVPSELPEKSH